MRKSLMAKRCMLLAVVLLVGPAGKGSVRNRIESFQVGPAFSKQLFRSLNRTECLPSAESRFLPDSRESMRDELTDEKYQVELARLDKLARDGNLDALAKAGDKLEERWGKQGGEFYGLLMLNLASLIVNGFIDEKIYSLSQKYATQALEKSNTFSLELETRLLPALAVDIFSRSSSSDA